MAANPDRELIEQALPGYELGAELGRGAWGVVLSGRHRRLDRRVAIKQLPRAFAADPAVSERFLLEARMAAALEHPHIVPVYDYVEQDGLALIVMERCPSTVAARFHGEGIHHDEACAAVLATCSALAYAHGRNVLHRDIKPENLMIAEDGVVKLGDFGIARALDVATRLTATGTVLGTPAYMSPEQAGGEELGPHSDVYSTGVVLYELLSGDLPFEETDSVGALLRQHLFEPPRPLLAVRPDVPEPIAAVVDRALIKDTAERYRDASAFGVDLAEATARAFGAGWPRERGFALFGAPEIVAATERGAAGAGRGETVVVRGRAQTVIVPPPDAEDPGTAAPAGSPTIAPSGVPAAAPAPPPRAPSAPPPPPGAAPTPGPGSNRGRWLAAGGVLAAVVVVILVALVSAGGDGADVGNGDPRGDASGDRTVGNGDGDGEPGDAAASDSATDSPSVTGPQLVIGTLIDDAGFGGHGDQADAMELAVADVDDTGGVLGQPVLLMQGVYGDEASLLEITSGHLAAGAAAVVGPSDPLDTGTVMQAVTGAGSILMSATDFFARPDDSGLYFQTRVPELLVGIGAVLLLPDTVSTVAVVTRSGASTPVDVATRAAVRERLEARGIAPTPVELDGDVTAAAAGVAVADPDAVIIHGVVDLTDLYAALIDAGVGPSTRPYVVVGNDGGAVDMDQGRIEGVVGIRRDFLTGAALEERVPASDFSADAAQAFDAVIILALAAEQAGSLEPTDIAAQLPAVTTSGEQCATFAECKALVAAGTDIDYVGPGGPYEISPRSGRPTAGYYRVSTVGESGFALGEAERVVIRAADL